LSGNLPNTKVDNKDPGDMVQNRFRFQAAYAGYTTLRLLGENSEYDCIYCEQYEDVLVKLKNGLFIGIQVKTKDKSLGPFKFNDDEIMLSIKRFIRHEIEFPKRFSNYIIGTNAGFASGTNDNNLRLILENVKKCHGSIKCLKILDFSEKLDRLSKLANCKKSLALLVLNKLSVVDWADLDNYETVLAHDIGVITNNQHQPSFILEAIAGDLIALASKTACRSTDLNEPSYYKLLRAPEEAISDAVLENKRITSDMVDACLNKYLHSVITLQSIDPSPILLSPKGTRIMEIKMQQGGLNLENIDLMKNNNYATRRLFIGWLYKWGKIKAELQADNISLLVRNECQEIKNTFENGSPIYGPEMLQVINENLRKSHATLASQYKDLQYPHLLGIAGILTEECKLWWSKPFLIEKQENE
jgi:hypothetical protein